MDAGKREFPVDGLKNFVYLAYLDDSDTRSKRGRWQVLSAVIVKDSDFSTCELLSSIIVQDLMPEEKVDKFEEFHACELFGGYGVFEGIDQTKRLWATEKILGLLHMPLTVVYGAVDAKLLGQEAFGSADPVDVCFRICAEGIDKWLSSKFIEELQSHAMPTGETQFPISNPHLGLLILDDCNKETKKTLQDSFRTLRPRVRPPNHTHGKLSNLHDDMYFGDSRFSVGIQLADLCSYFIARHLEGDVAIEGFYKLIEPHIVHSKCIPNATKEESAKSTVADHESSPSVL